MEMKALTMLVLVSVLVVAAASNVVLHHPTMENGVIKGEGECCDFCISPRIFPPRYTCRDVKTSCPAACNICECSESSPPECICYDSVSGRCPERCTSAGFKEMLISQVSM